MVELGQKLMIIDPEKIPNGLVSISFVLFILRNINENYKNYPRTSVYDAQYAED